MQDEGTTTTTVIEEQGDVQEITETTITIENKTTGNILHKNTGVVASKYEGDMDSDWGGIGSASMPTCPTEVGGTGRCGKGTSSTLTTFQQNINIAQFHIEDGGALVIINREFVEAAAVLFADENGGRLTISNKDGSGGAVLGLDVDGGRLAIINNKGKLTSSLP